MTQSHELYLYELEQFTPSDDREPNVYIYYVLLQCTDIFTSSNKYFITDPMILITYNEYFNVFLLKSIIDCFLKKFTFFFSD